MFQEARKTDKTVTLTYVKDWYEKNVNKTRYYGGKNSFVAPHANYEYQSDLFLNSDLENQKFTTGMLALTYSQNLQRLFPYVARGLTIT